MRMVTGRGNAIQQHFNVIHPKLALPGLPLRGLAWCRPHQKREGIMRVIIAVLIICSIAFAAPMMQDLFDDGNADGWTEYTTNPDSAHYYVESGCYHMAIEDQDGMVAAFSGDETTGNPWCMSIPDYCFYCKGMAYAPTSHLGFALRMCAPLSQECGYMVWLRFTMDDVQLWRHDGPSNYLTLDSQSMALQHGEFYWIRFDAWGGALKVKVWQGSFWDEPDQYTLEAYDCIYGDPGSIGMGCQSWGVTSNHAAFDSVMVCDPLALRASSWGEMKVIMGM